MDPDYPSPTKHYKLIAIVGPTASGKSELAMKVANEFNGEIISADSWQVYKGFNIGTSKPTKEDLKKIKHHLIDVADPEEGFNAPRFKELAENAISDICKRGKLPVLVGGTGLYIDSLLYDFNFLPTLGPDERAKLNAMDLTDLLELAKKRVIDLAGIDIRNKRRIIRAIEANGQKPARRPLKRGSVIVGIRLPKDKLHLRVGYRIKLMIDNGLEAEITSLVKNFGWNIEPMKGIGYKEWEPYFEGEQSLEETKARIAKNTIDLAKRQMTWFKRNPDINWFDNQDDAYNFLNQRL